jgi:hypothetical protein
MRHSHVGRIIGRTCQFLENCLMGHMGLLRFVSPLYTIYQVEVPILHSVENVRESTAHRYPLFSLLAVLITGLLRS